MGIHQFTPGFRPSITALGLPFGYLSLRPVLVMGALTTHLERVGPRGTQAELTVLWASWTLCLELSPKH